MPEKDLTPEEEKAIREWIKSQDGHWHASHNDGFIGSGVYCINLEPLELKAFKINVPLPEPNVRYSLLCSNVHAQQLEEAGIVKFTPAPEEITK